MTEGDQPIETHDAEQRQTRRALAALVTFVLALAAIGAGAASWQLHKAEYEDSQANLRRFARAVTEQTAWDLHQIDTVLQLTSTWLARSDKLEASGTARLQERVQPRLTALLSVQSIIVSNQEGTLRMVTRDSIALPTTGFDPRPLFEYFRDHPDAGLTVGAPFRLVGSQDWAFPISRPIVTGKGKLTGAVTLVVDAPVLAERFRLVRPTTDHHVALLRSDATLMIDAAGLASMTPTGFLSAGAANSAGEGDRDSWLTADGVESIAYLRPVSDFPLVIAVSLPQSVVTAKIRTALIVISGVIAAAGFGLALIAVVLGRRILLSQARLRQQRDFVTRVLDSADVMVFVQDSTGRLISCNAEAEKLGYPQNEILALDPFVHLVPREEQEQVAAIQRRARGAAAPEAYECHLLTRAGERRLIRWSTTNLPDAGGRRDWVLSVGTDVTEERTQQDAIARNNAIMDRAQSIAHMCYWTARADSADAKWTDCTFTYSENVEQVFGYSFAEIDVALADFIERFVHPDDQEDMAEAYRAFYEGADQRFAISFRLKQRDGSYRYIRDFAEKRVDTGGGVLELVGMSQDVTQQLAADAMLRESEIKLRRAHRLAKLCYWTYDPVAAAAGGGDRLVFSGDTQEILGAPAEALNGAATSPLIAMAHPEDRERILQEWRAFMASSRDRLDLRLPPGARRRRDSRCQRVRREGDERPRSGGPGHRRRAGHHRPQAQRAGDRAQRDAAAPRPPPVAGRLLGVGAARRGAILRPRLAACLERVRGHPGRQAGGGSARGDRPRRQVRASGRSRRRHDCGRGLRAPHSGSLQRPVPRRQAGPEDRPRAHGGRAAARFAGPHPLRDRRHPGRDRAARARARADDRQAHRRDRQPHQDPVPGQHEPRAAHAAERRDRLLAADPRPGVRRRSLSAMSTMPTTSTAAARCCWR